jgi:hypothetical protein
VPTLIEHRLEHSERPARVGNAEEGIVVELRGRGRDENVRRTHGTAARDRCGTWLLDIRVREASDNRVDVTVDALIDDANHDVLATETVAPHSLDTEEFPEYLDLHGRLKRAAIDTAARTRQVERMSGTGFLGESVATVLTPKEGQRRIGPHHDVVASRQLRELGLVDVTGDDETLGPDVGILLRSGEPRKRCRLGEHDLS